MSKEVKEYDKKDKFKKIQASWNINSERSI